MTQLYMRYLVKMILDDMYNIVMALAKTASAIAMAAIILYAIMAAIGYIIELFAIGLHKFMHR